MNLANRAVVALFLTGTAIAQETSRQTEVAPGMMVSSESLVWILQDSEQPKLLPLLHQDARVIDDTATNLARATLRFKQRKPVAIDGMRSDTRLHGSKIRLFVQVSDAARREMAHSLPADRFSFAIVKLTNRGQQREVGHFEFSRFKNKSKYFQDIVATTQMPLHDSWLQLSPAKPLPPGEYAFVPTWTRSDIYSPWIFDFGVD